MFVWNENEAETDQKHILYSTETGAFRIGKQRRCLAHVNLVKAKQETRFGELNHCIWQTEKIKCQNW